MSKSLLKSEKLCLLHCPHPQSFSGFIISNWVDLAHCAFGKFSLPFAKVFLSFIFLEIESRRFCSIFFPRFGIKLSCNSPEFPSCFFFSVTSAYLLRSFNFCWCKGNSCPLGASRWVLASSSLVPSQCFRVAVGHLPISPPPPLPWGLVLHLSSLCNHPPLLMSEVSWAPQPYRGFSHGILQIRSLKKLSSFPWSSDSCIAFCSSFRIIISV